MRREESDTSNVIPIDSRRRRRTTTTSMFGKGLTDRAMEILSWKFSDPVTESDFRNRALFQVMSSTGLRAKEILGLRLSDMLESPEGEILFRYIRKGGRTAFTVISEKALNCVKEYHETFQIRSEYFFLTLPTNRTGGARVPMSTRQLQRIVNAWGVPTADGKKAHPHAIRHTVGQRVFDVYGSMAAQKKLGHSSPVVTSKYYTRPFFDGTDILNW